MSSQAAFTLFPLLPAELRLDIWRLSCHQRVVEVFYDSEQDQCTTTATPPAVLHACHESRLEALRIYKMSFGTKTHEPRIYFCHDMDTLYLPRPPFMGYDNDSRSFTELVMDADDIVNLAIDHVQPTVRRPWETYSKYALMQSFPRVREVFLVLDTGLPADEDCHGDVGLADPAGDMSDLCRLLADVKESFTYEVGGAYKIGEKEDEFVEQPRLPPLVLKSKVMSGHQE
ncbi:Uu.00g019080.m01.CDS01 [Anthostomella pinea]|uniref:Uu.00g019080.m01.CDS01 n=1 Tax=Anthostomella pinea TaxID=933095 RepID=A0AAI8YQL5_9PEZI|nr:Uu.00g019080.m01.CDS01 [Anthostomella pinea]